MATDVPEIRLALFGTTGSGKTTLLASYFGNQQRNSFEVQHGYRLEADDTSDGNRLLSQYYKMEKGEFPVSTDVFLEYRFSFKMTTLPEPALRIVWYDYPGGWWERTPKEDSENKARSDAFAKLLSSHVGIVLVDGQEYARSGLPYIHHLLDQFRAEMRRISDHCAASGVPLVMLPRQWIIGISKADRLMPETTAEVICREIVVGATDQLEGIAKAVNSKSFGHQYLLLSSVRGESGHVVDAHQFIGLQLVAPVALVSVLSELAESASKGQGYGVLQALVQGLASVVDFVDKLDDFLPQKYQILTQLLRALAIKDGIDKGSEYFAMKQREAVRRGNALAAAAAAFRAELASPAAGRAFFKNQS